MTFILIFSQFFSLRREITVLNLRVCLTGSGVTYTTVKVSQDINLPTKCLLYTIWSQSYHQYFCLSFSAVVNCGPPDISDLMAFTEYTGMMYHDKFSISCSTHYYHLVGNGKCVQILMHNYSN